MSFLRYTNWKLSVQEQKRILVVGSVECTCIKEHLRSIIQIPQRINAPTKLTCRKSNNELSESQKWMQYYKWLGNQFCPSLSMFLIPLQFCLEATLPSSWPRNIGSELALLLGLKAGVLTQAKPVRTTNLANFNQEDSIQTFVCAFIELSLWLWPACGKYGNLKLQEPLQGA